MSKDREQRGDPVKCHRFIMGRTCGGELREWRGTDGHNGYEWFTTCKRCGATT